MSSAATGKSARARRNSPLAKTGKSSPSAKGMRATSSKQPSRKTKASSPGSIYAQMYRATPLERIDIIRKGIPAGVVIETGNAMGLHKETLLSTLHFTRATVNRRIKANAALPAEYSERIIGLQKLIGQVEIMVVESGNPSTFNAAHWIAEWLEQPVPALNHARPADFMDTIEGQELVSSLLARMQSGSYA